MMQDAPTIYHGTPITPTAAFEAIMPGRAACISYGTPTDWDRADRLCPFVMIDNGAFKFWNQARKAGREWDEERRDWSPYYNWLEPRLFHPGRWAVIPDIPAAPSQLNDALLAEWPHGQKGAPLFHMDGPVHRLGRLCDQYDRVCLGWIGHPKREPVGCDAYRRKMDEIAALFGNRWPVIHMMRGVAVARDYPFRQRRQYQPRTEWTSLSRRLSAIRFLRSDTIRPMGGPSPLRRPLGGEIS